MQIEGSTFSNTSFLGHSQETSPLRNKNWEGLVQAGLLAVWTCPCRVCAPLLGGILQHHPQVLATSAQLSHMPQGVQPSFSISCYENASLEGVTLSSSCPRYLETKATQSQPIPTCGRTEAPLCPSEGPWGQEWHWMGVAHQLFEAWGLRKTHTAPLHHLALEMLVDISLQIRLQGAVRCRVDFQSSDFLSKAPAEALKLDLSRFIDTALLFSLLVLRLSLFSLWDIKWVNCFPL